MSKRVWALLAAFGSTFIYGINHTLAKGIMPDFVKPFGIIMLRTVGGTILFWLIGFWGPKQTIEKRDWGRLFICAFFGMSVNMLSFFKGLSLSTPINSAVLVTATPIVVVILSIFLIKEKIRWIRGSGIVIGLVGALLLILMGNEIRQDAPNIPLGNILFLVNATTYGTYLILVKKLLEKYHPFSIMKWLFLIGMIISFPVTLPEYLEINWQTMPLEIWLKIAFVVLGTTFLTYLFNIIALRELKASTVSAFVYLQPLIGIIYALITGKDHLTLVKIAATFLVLLGVYLVSKKPKLPGSQVS